MPPLLSMHGVSKRFGATLALKDVSLEVSAGEVLALIGENGAGKSTLMKVLSGAHRPDSGRMELAGQPYSPPNPHQGRLAGVAMIYQELNLALDLSIEDNLLLGQEQHHWGFINRRGQRARVQRVLEQLGHPDLRPDTPVRQLSVGARQLVEIGRALISDARVIVFDEPTSSLTRADAQRLFEVIRRLQQSGIGIIYISHFLEEIRHLCSRYTVLRDGEVAGSGDLAGVTESQIVALMVGRNVADLFPHVPHTPGADVLDIQRLTGQKFPTDVTLAIRKGEIFGIAGLIGAGRTELLRCLFALDPVSSGVVRIHSNRPVATTQGRIRAGMGLVSEDRKGEGLAQACSINDNLTNSRLGPYSTWGFLNLGRRRSAASKWMHTLQIKARDPEQEVQTLSGGNQQKVAIARVMHQDADIYLLDEPTRGIDVGTKAEIYRLMGELAAAGKTIVFVSSYVTELLSVCDRVGVMARGRLREVRAAQDWTEESVLSCAIAGTERPAMLS